MSSPNSFTDPSDRLKALFDEAIRKPDISITEKTLDRPGSIFQETAPFTEMAAPVVEVPATTPVAVSMESAMPLPVAQGGPVEPVIMDAPHTEQDKELAAMLEEREIKLKKRRSRIKVASNLLILAIVVGPTVGIMVNPTWRAKFDWTVSNLVKGVDDVKSIANTKESFDGALEKIADRGAQIDGATTNLGVDPTSVGADEDLEMTAELKQMMGEDAGDFKKRRGNLEKMGFVAKKVTGMGDEEETEKAAPAQ